MEIFQSIISLWKPPYPKLILNDFIHTLLKKEILTVAPELKASMLPFLKWIHAEVETRVQVPLGEKTLWSQHLSVFTY